MYGIYSGCFGFILSNRKFCIFGQYVGKSMFIAVIVIQNKANPEF